MIPGLDDILITIKVSKMNKVTSQALYRKNSKIRGKNKKINESSDDSLRLGEEVT